MLLEGYRISASRRLPPALWILALACGGGAWSGAQEISVSGTDGLRRWHKVTLTMAGPQADEDGVPNPFMDHRMTVTFQHLGTGLTYVVPGYFAADGDAANTSATGGDKWRAHLSPDHTGAWTYHVSFREGAEIAISDDPTAGTAAAPYDGVTGSFDILETDKAGRDHRAKGRLQHVGMHHLQFASGEYFLKAGADSPENFLAYDDFDNTPDTGGRRKSWQPHIEDWREGDPTWKGARGKGIIGAINYLASKGMNAVSFLTYSYQGDDGNVFPYTAPARRHRMDCSKLDQWEIVFEHADRMGIYLHFKTQEQENDQDMDGGALRDDRTLYYRELIARYSHHLALNWNLGEENSNTTEQRRQFARYFWTHDPYRHNIVLHTYPGSKDDVYTPLLGEGSDLTGASLQSGAGSVFGDTLRWVNESAAAGRPWVVANDEQNPANIGIKPDGDDFAHDGVRRDVLWGNIMAGGAGVESFFGSAFAHSDFTCEDFRSRDHWWDLCRFALEFFSRNDVRFWAMRNDNGRVSSSDAWCLAGGGEFVVYLRSGGTTDLDLSDSADAFEVGWYDPRVGGELEQGSVPGVSGGGLRRLGSAPYDPSKDWVVLVRRPSPDRNLPPSVDAGANQTVTLPRMSNSVTVFLSGTVSDDGKPDGTILLSWTKESGPGTVDFEYEAATDTAATITGVGEYLLRLRADDGELSTADTVRITVKPFSSEVTRTYHAVDDAYIEVQTAYDNGHLKVAYNLRTSYLKFVVNGLPDGGDVLRAVLSLRQRDDAGNGTIHFYRGSHSNWTEGNLSATNAPAPRDLVAARSGSIGDGQTIDVDVTRLVLGNGTYTLLLMMGAGGNDVWFGSDESAWRPELRVTAGEEASGLQVPGDCTQDGELDLSDATCLLGHLYFGDPARLPCGDGTTHDRATVLLFDANGDGIADLSDAVAVLGYLYQGTAPHVLGTGCVPISGCPESSGCP